MAISIYHSSLISDANLVNYYRLNGDAIDYKGTANGSATGVTYSTSYSPFAATEGSQGASFSNTPGSGSATQYISAAFLAPGSGNFTYYAWVYFVSLSTGGNSEEVLHNESNGATGHPNIYFGYDGTSKFTSMLADSSGSGINLVTSTTIVINTWYQVVLTRSGNTHQLYLNGSANGSSASSGNTWISSSNGQIGRRLNTTYTNQAPLNGYVADAAMFNRALTSTEINNLYTQTYTSVNGNFLTFM